MSDEKKLLKREEICELLGISMRTFERHGFAPSGKERKFNLYDIQMVCEQIFADRLGISNEPSEINELNIALKREQLRKLKIENDLKSNELVWSRDVVPGFMRVVETMANTMDGVPSRVKMEMPDISQSALDVINRSLAIMRNEAVRAAKQLEPRRNENR